MPERSFSPGTDEMQTLLDKHEYSNCVGLETSVSERNCVPAARENPFYSNSRTCVKQTIQTRVG